MSAQHMPYMLSAKGLKKSFGAVTAADDVNIDIPIGQRVSLIGSNGAGKTTFVNMVTGYLKPDAGRIELDGKSIEGLGPRQITGMGIARSFQIPQLALDMTALDNMLVAAACWGLGTTLIRRFPTGLHALTFTHAMMPPTILAMALAAFWFEGTAVGMPQAWSQ